MENKTHIITERDSKNILGMITSVLAVLLLFGILAIHNNILTISFISIIILITTWTIRKELLYLFLISDKITKGLIILIFISLVILLFLYRKKIKNILTENFVENYYTLFKKGKPYPRKEEIDED